MQQVKEEPRSVRQPTEAKIIDRTLVEDSSSEEVDKSPVRILSQIQVQQAQDGPKIKEGNLFNIKQENKSKNKEYSPKNIGKSEPTQKQSADGKLVNYKVQAILPFQPEVTPYDANISDYEETLGD